MGLLGQLIPFVLLAVLLGGLGVVGYHIYISVTQIRSAAKDRMSRGNINFTKEGMRVGVRDMGNENYVDRTQRMVVKAWELSGKTAPGDVAGDNGRSKRKKKSN